MAITKSNTVDFVRNDTINTLELYIVSQYWYYSLNKRFEAQLRLLNTTI